MVAAVGPALVGDLLVGQHRAQRRAPVDRHLGHVGQAILVDEPPLLVGLQLGELELPDRTPTRLDVRHASGRAAGRRCRRSPPRAGPISSLSISSLDRPGGIGLRVVPTVEHLQEDPLRPAVVVRVGGGQLGATSRRRSRSILICRSMLAMLPLGGHRAGGRRARRRTARPAGRRRRSPSGAGRCSPASARSGRRCRWRCSPPGAPRAGPRRWGRGTCPARRTWAGRVEALLARVGLAERRVLLPVLLPLALDGGEIVTGHGVSPCGRLSAILCQPPVLAARKKPRDPFNLPDRGA